MPRTSKPNWPNSPGDNMLIDDDEYSRPMTARELNLTIDDKNLVVSSDTLINALQGNVTYKIILLLSI